MTSRTRTTACVLGTFVLAASSGIGGRRGATKVYAQDPSIDLGTITPIDVPGATNTFPIDINAAGLIVGRYLSGGQVHGFLRLPSGDLTTVDFPGASFTAATAIDDLGDIVGQYSLPAAPGQRHGFLLQDGVFSSVDPPGSVFTNALGINERGDIVGRYCLAPCTPTSPGAHGFLFRDGEFTTIDVPDAARTDAWRINDRGQIAGAFPSSSGVAQIFLLTLGQFTTVALPGGQPVSSDIGGLNERGDLVGTYCDVASPCVIAPQGTHGFLLRNGFTTIDISGALATTANGINARGDIVGSYSTNGINLRGFLLSQSLSQSSQPW